MDVDPKSAEWTIACPRLLSGSSAGVVADERRYVYRLVGTADVEVRGYDPTGKSVLEGFFGPSIDDVLANYDRVVSSRTPHIDPQHFMATNGRYVTEETIFLPLSDDGENVNIVLVFSQSRDVGPAAEFRSAVRGR